MADHERPTRNPVWSRDELVVALDFYLSHREQIPGKASDEIRELSRSISAIARSKGLSGSDSFRNTNGVYMKLMNFRSLDPDYTSGGKTGLGAVGRADRLVWEEFSKDRRKCKLEAESIADEATSARRFWAFAADPRRYRIREAVANLQIDTWTTKGRPIRVGDRAIIWQTLDSQRQRGVVALAEVVGPPVVCSDISNPYWIDQEEAALQSERVKVRYLPLKEPVWIGGLHSELISRLSVSRARGGTVFNLVPEQWDALAAIAAAEIGDELLRRKSPTGQGLGLTAGERKAVERYAVERAITHYQETWDAIEDVGALECYDLKCRSGTLEHHVEVKGTTGGCASILLTKNEVEHARRFPSVSLFVVFNIQLSEADGDHPVAGGGDTCILDPWDIATCELTALSYECRLPT